MKMPELIVSLEKRRTGKLLPEKSLGGHFDSCEILIYSFENFVRMQKVHKHNLPIAESVSGSIM